MPEVRPSSSRVEDGGQPAAGLSHLASPVNDDLVHSMNFESVRSGPTGSADVRRNRLPDATSSARFDRIARLASQLVRAPVSIILLEDDGQLLFLGRNKSADFNGERAEAAIPPQLCRHVVETGEPLIIGNIGKHALLESNPSGGEIKIAACAAIPLTTDDGQTFGCFCAVDSAPRNWLPGEVGVLSELAALAMTEISLHELKDELSAMKVQLGRKNKLETVGNIAMGVSHELRNILCSIGGNADLALQVAGPGSPAREYMDEVRKAGRRACDLVQNVLGLACPQASQRRIQSLQPVIKDSARLVRATIAANVEFNVTCEEGAPDVLVNAAQIEQVILNLVINAGHALEKKPGRISLALGAVTVEQSEANNSDGINLPAGRYARITVADSGKGMDAATMEQVFEPFFTTKQPGQGTGLGLAIVQNVVREHGGCIQVQSQPGQGAAFTIYFPAANVKRLAHEKP